MPGGVEWGYEKMEKAFCISTLIPVARNTMVASISA